MGDASAIEWTDATWNPVRGCTKISAGCKFCYAERFAERWRGVPGHAFEQGFDLRLVPEALALPLRWRRPRRIFVNSMSDLFHDGVSDEYIAAVFGVMAAAPQHTFQVLTKRPERMRAWFDDERRASDVAAAAEHAMCQHGVKGFVWDSRGADVWKYGGKTKAADVKNRRAFPGWPLPNVWLGVSVEDQRAADERIPLLLQCPAAVRFLSCEPLLGPLDLPFAAFNGAESFSAMGGLDWTIVGGESGPGARPCAVEWIDAIVHDCNTAKVPVFVKQLGAVVNAPDPFTTNGSGWPVAGPGSATWERVDLTGAVADRWRVRLQDRKGADPLEWPERLRVQEFPVRRA